MESLFPTLGCWQSVCPCRRRDDLYSSPQVWMREDRSHPPCRSCDSIQPRVFDPEAVSCRLITPVVVPKNKSEAPDSCQYRYEFQVHAMLADQKLARNWPSHLALSHNDDKRLERRPIRVWLLSIRRRVRISSLNCDLVVPR
jgi:hypothetical protein